MPYYIPITREPNKIRIVSRDLNRLIQSCLACSVGPEINGCYGLGVVRTLIVRIKDNLRRTIIEYHVLSSVMFFVINDISAENNLNVDISEN